MTNLEEIIDAVGGMSRFQIVQIFIILGAKFLYGWGLMMMSFAGVTPEEWWCEQNSSNLSNQSHSSLAYLNQSYSSFDSSTNRNHTDNLGQCTPSTNGSDCTFLYSDEKHTVVSEWNLVCDKRLLPSTMTAVQMGGLLVGCLVSGQLSDLIGRKKVYFFSLALHGLFNLVSAFSVSWQMFMALRFPLGVSIGALLTVYYPYMGEFLSKKWLPIIGAFPSWQLGMSLLALTSWLRPDWSDVHLILAAIHVPFLATWFLAPESLRWLAVHGKIKEAEKVVDEISRYNKRPKPANTEVLLRKLAEEELSNRQSGQKYTYLDIFRPWSLCWKSLVLQFIWMILSLVFYGIAFGVGRLSGNLYLNIFFIALIDIPGVAIGSFLAYKIGRKWSAILFLSLCSVSAITVVVISVVVPSESTVGGTVIRVLALVCRMSTNSAWHVMSVMVIELYPTPIRNIGFGGASTAARIGGIMSPYIFSVAGDSLLFPFLTVGLTMLVSVLLALTLPETRDIPFEDTTASIVKTSIKQTQEVKVYDKVPLEENTQAV